MNEEYIEINLPEGPLRSEVWSDPDSQDLITANGTIAAYLNECGQVVIIEKGCTDEADDAAVVFEHEHLQSLINILTRLAAENPEDHYCDSYREALLLCDGSQS